MGVPKFYRWQSERYPCLSEIVKENQIPEFDNLYLDMNGIIHNCTHPNDDDVHFRLTEEQMYKAIFHYIEVLFRIIKPRKVFFMAVDGVAPRAKMNQQRGRRFRSAQEAEEREKEALKKGETLPKEKRFDSNCITPGTDFMCRLQEQLKYLVNLKITGDPEWQGIRVFLSGHETPGEGEHKIMDFIRAERARKDYDPNTRHCLYGLDADLMMLGLTSHEPHFSLLREEVRFGKQAKRPTTVEDTTFHLLHLSLFREYLALEFGALKDQISWFNIENIIDDWVLLGFLVGNDFVPHLPDLHISHSALPLLYKTYIEVMPTLDGYLNEGGFLNLPRFEQFMKKLSKFDYDNFDSQAIDLSFLEGKQSEGAWKSKKVEMKKAIRERLQEEMPGFMNMGWIENKDIDEPSAEEEEDSDEEDPIEIEFRMRKTDYYDNKMGFRQITKVQRSRIVSDYIHAIQWILHYYYNGIQSWSWYYPHHYSPYMSDLKDFADLKLHFERGEPFLPFQQLLAVLPPASKDHVPDAFWPLMLNETSPIIEYYPQTFEQDLNGKLQSWEAVVLIPFINEDRLLAAMKMYEHKMTGEEKWRNRHSPHLLYTTDPSAPHRYLSTLVRGFRDIPKCIAKCELVKKEAFQIPISRLKKGLLEGVRLGVYFPGFPTLYHLNFESEVRNADVKVFQQLSRGDNMILSVNAADPNPNVRQLAQDWLGQSVYAEWPHLKEVKVMAISDGEYRYELVENSGSVQATVQEVRLKGVEAEKWRRECQQIGEEYFRRKGVNIRETKILLYACPLLGRRYVCGHSGNVTLEKQWTISPIPYAYQVTMKDIAVHDPTFQQFKTLQEVYPVNKACFMLGMPHYGCEGTVVSTEKDRVQVLFSTPNDPNLEALKANQSSQSSQYMEGYTLAQRLGVSSMQVSRLTGSVFVTKGPRPSRSDEGFRGSSVNVGLNLKFNKTEQEVPGFTRRNEAGKWVYSYKLLDTLEEYLSKFPIVWMFLNGKGFNDPLYEDEMFVGSQSTLEEVKRWIEAQPCSKAPKGKIGAVDLEAPTVDRIITEICKVPGSKKKVKLSVRPHLLFRPMRGMGNVIPDPEATYELFDRVVNVREGFTVPLGLRGVVIGIKTGATILDATYDILFDDVFEGGLELRCDWKQCYHMPPTALINISYGQRKVKGQQKYEKTTAVVKPQVKQPRGPDSSGHTQSQEYYQTRMARLGSPGATAGSRERQGQASLRGGRTNHNTQDIPAQSKTYAGTIVREDAGGSPISYAAAADASLARDSAPSPVRTAPPAKQGASGMQALGKIPSGKAGSRQDRQRREARGSPRPEKEKGVTILKRNQTPSDAQNGPRQDSTAGNRTLTGVRVAGENALPPKERTSSSYGPQAVVTEDGSREGKQGQASDPLSARLPRLSREEGGGSEKAGDGAAAAATVGSVDELSAIWQKLMTLPDCKPARSEGDASKQAAPSMSILSDEEFVTSVGSRDDAESDGMEDEDEMEDQDEMQDKDEIVDQDEMERMTPNTYRKSQTEQLCRLLNIGKSSDSGDAADGGSLKPEARGTAPSQPGYAKQVSVAELFESAKKTIPQPRSPINLPQGGPMVQSKPLGHVAPNLQAVAVLTSTSAQQQDPQPQKPHQRAPPQPMQSFMVHSPGKHAEVGQVIAPPPPASMAQSPAPPLPLPQQKGPPQSMQPFMVQSPGKHPQLGQTVPPPPPASLAQSPAVPLPHHKAPPAPHHMQPFMAQSLGGKQQTGPMAVPLPPSSVAHPPPLQRVHQPLPQAPFTTPPNPPQPGGYAQPPFQAPAFMTPHVAPRGLVAPMMGPPVQPGWGFGGGGPPLPISLPTAVETLKGWCLAQQLSPPKFTFSKLPQGGVWAVCSLGTGITYEGPPCPNESQAIERSAGVALHKLRIAPVHQFVGPSMVVGPSGMMPPVNHSLRPRGMQAPPGYRQGVAAPLMAPSPPQPSPAQGANTPSNWANFVPLQVTKQLATTPTKSGNTSESHMTSRAPLAPTATENPSSPHVVPSTVSRASPSHGLQAAESEMPLREASKDPASLLRVSQTTQDIPTQIEGSGTKGTADSNMDCVTKASSQTKTPKSSKRSSVKLAINFSSGKKD